MVSRFSRMFIWPTTCICIFPPGFEGDSFCMKSHDMHVGGLTGLFVPWEIGFSECLYVQIRIVVGWPIKRGVSKVCTRFICVSTFPVVKAESTSFCFALWRTTALENMQVVKSVHSNFISLPNYMQWFFRKQ